MEQNIETKEPASTHRHAAPEASDTQIPWIYSPNDLDLNRLFLALLFIV